MRADSSTPLNVWFLTSSTEIWGAQQSLTTLIAHMDERTVSPRIFAASSQFVAHCQENGIQADYIGIPKRKSALLRSLLWAISFIRNCRGKPDIIVVFDLDLVPMADLFKCALQRPRIVLDLHNYLTTDRGRRRIRLLSSRFHKVIANSRFTASQLPARTSPAILTRPIERDLAQSRSDSPRNVVGVVGRLDPDKHLEFALEVAKRLPEIDFEMRGTASAQWRSYADGLKSSSTSNVKWVGRVDRSEAFAGLKVMFLPNHREALGRVVLEAQISRVAVVVPSSGGSPELVENGRTGFIYESCDPASAVTALRQALQVSPSIIEEAESRALETSDPGRYAAAYTSALLSESPAPQ